MLLAEQGICAQPYHSWVEDEMKERFENTCEGEFSFSSF